ncbi:MAG: hypothetical protein AAGC96_16645 [Pseudomonadota bacterium]
MLRTSATILFILFGVTVSAAAPACEDQALFMSNENILFLGDATEGAKPGDRRILDWRVHDAEGNALGSFHVITTVLGEAEDGHLITAVGSVIFPNGEIHATITTELPDASSSTRSSAQNVDWAIVGGTDAFAHAFGTLVTGPPADATRSLDDWSFDITMECRD